MVYHGHRRVALPWLWVMDCGLFASSRPLKLGRFGWTAKTSSFCGRNDGKTWFYQRFLWGFKFQTWVWNGFSQYRCNPFGTQTWLAGHFPIFYWETALEFFQSDFPRPCLLVWFFLGFSSVLSAPNRKIGVQWGVFPPHTWHLAVSIPRGRSKSSGMMKNRGFFHGEDDAYKGE